MKQGIAITVNAMVVSFYFLEVLEQKYKKLTRKL